MKQFGFDGATAVLVTDKLRSNTRAVVDRYNLYEAEATILRFQNCWKTRLWIERLLIVKAALHLYSALPYDPANGPVDISTYKISMYKALHEKYSKKLEKQLRPKNGLFEKKRGEINQFYPLMEQFDSEIQAKIIPVGVPPPSPTDYIKF